MHFGRSARNSTAGLGGPWQCGCGWGVGGWWGRSASWQGRVMVEVGFFLRGSPSRMVSEGDKCRYDTGHLPKD